MFGKKRSAKERQAYHFEMSKKGTYDINHKTGEYYKISDFARGVHLGKAQMIQKQRIRTAKYYKNKKNNEIANVFIDGFNNNSPKLRY